MRADTSPETIIATSLAEGIWHGSGAGDFHTDFCGCINSHSHQISVEMPSFPPHHAKTCCFSNCITPQREDAAPGALLALWCLAMLNSPLPCNRHLPPVCLLLQNAYSSPLLVFQWNYLSVYCVVALCEFWILTPYDLQIFPFPSAVFHSFPLSALLCTGLLVCCNPLFVVCFCCLVLSVSHQEVMVEANAGKVFVFSSFPKSLRESQVLHVIF